jgi:uncharacterized protein YndB with AHSA1/START domain
MQKEIKHSWFFNQSPQEVWEYLTKPELLEQWLMKNDFKPTVGRKFHFIGECNDEGKAAAHCEVLEIIPYSRLSYSWQTNSVKDNKPFSSKVVWTLTPKNNGTELQLVHNGFTLMEDVIAHNDGWTRIGNKIVERLNAIKIKYDSTNA